MSLRNLEFDVLGGFKAAGAYLRYWLRRKGLGEREA